MNQKYALHQIVHYVFYLVPKFNLLVKCHPSTLLLCHCCPSSCSLQRPLEICFKIRQQLFIELYNKLCSKNAKSAVLSSSSYRLIKRKYLFPKKVKGWIFRKDIITKTLFLFDIYSVLSPF